MKQQQEARRVKLKECMTDRHKRERTNVNHQQFAAYVNRILQLLIINHRNDDRRVRQLTVEFGQSVTQS